MRNLTITRNKTFVGCLGKMKVYVEDPIMGDTTIGTARCRRLGDLKNGETKTFSIDENETRIFVIADSLSKSYCNEFCTVPAGSNDVFLTGQNRYNPANGHAFQFDGQTDEAVLQNRRKNTKRGIIILVAAVVVGFIIGFLISYFERPDPKTFTLDIGAQITLTDEFEIDEEDEDYVSLASYDTLVSFYRFDFEDTLLPGFADQDEKEFGEFWMGILEMDDVEVKSHGENWYFEYKETSEGDELYFLNVMLKGEDAFWVVEFICFADEKGEWIDEFWKWTDSVELTK